MSENGLISLLGAPLCHLSAPPHTLMSAHHKELSYDCVAKRNPHVSSLVWFVCCLGE